MVYRTWENPKSYQKKRAKAPLTLSNCVLLTEVSVHHSLIFSSSTTPWCSAWRDSSGSVAKLSPISFTVWSIGRASSQSTRTDPSGKWKTLTTCGQSISNTTLLHCVRLACEPLPFLTSTWIMFSWNYCSGRSSWTLLSVCTYCCFNCYNTFVIMFRILSPIWSKFPSISTMGSTCIFLLDLCFFFFPPFCSSMHLFKMKGMVFSSLLWQLFLISVVGSKLLAFLCILMFSLCLCLGSVLLLHMGLLYRRAPFLWPKPHNFLDIYICHNIRKQVTFILKVFACFDRHPMKIGFEFCTSW